MFLYSRKNKDITGVREKHLAMEFVIKRVYVAGRAAVRKGTDSKASGENELKFLLGFFFTPLSLFFKVFKGF